MYGAEDDEESLEEETQSLDLNIKDFLRMKKNSLLADRTSKVSANKQKIQRKNEDLKKQQADEKIEVLSNPLKSQLPEKEEQTNKK